MSVGSINLIGVGPGDQDSLSLGALKAIERAPELWMSDIDPWTGDRAWLGPLVRGKKLVDLSGYYAVRGVRRDRVYLTIARRMAHLCRQGRELAFLFSGNPAVWVDITNHLKREALATGLDLRITPSMSFLDVIWRDTPFGLTSGLQLRATFLDGPDVSPHIDCVVGQVGDDGITAGTQRYDSLLRPLRRLYPKDHVVYVVGSDPAHSTQRTVPVRADQLAAVLPAFEPFHYVVIIPRVDPSRRRR